MKLPGSIAKRTSPSSWGGFCVWALLGAAAALGLLVFGFLASLPILLGVWLAVTRPALLRSGFGVMTGVGATLLYVAYVQRRGPGTVCWHTATASGCDQYLNPWPWLVAGATLVAVSFIAQARRDGPAGPRARSGSLRHGSRPRTATGGDPSPAGSHSHH